MAVDLEKETILASLTSPVSPTSEIRNQWITEKGIIVGIDISHSADSCSPPSTCPGIVKVNVLVGEKGVKRLPCWGCGKETSVHLGHLQDNFGLTKPGVIVDRKNIL